MCDVCSLFHCCRGAAALWEDYRDTEALLLRRARESGVDPASLRRMEQELLKPRSPRREPRSAARWLILCSFSLAAMCNGLMYSTEAAVTVPAEQFYGISEARILWLTVPRPAPSPDPTSALGSEPDALAPLSGRTSSTSDTSRSSSPRSGS